MLSPTKLLSLVTIASVFLGSATAQIKGFNYGATNSDGSCRGYSDFTHYFRTAQSLSGNTGFASARLYTSIQCGSTNTPISAFQAAIDTDTSILVGLWASAGQSNIDNEIAALKTAASQYGSAFASRVIGISVGSEDLYRGSAQGQANNAGIGANAATITSYISQVRSALQGTALSGIPIGHVDTWTAWILPENAQVASAVDWLGHNSFPYFETTRQNNGIDAASADFSDALSNTESVSGGKPVWVTETGWPVSGPTANQAVPSIQNAQTYWKQVGCPLFNSRNTWWYTLTDANPGQTDISFGIVPQGQTLPLYDLSC